MERRKAMAYAATSALILSSGLVAGAAVGGFNILGFRGQFSPVAGAQGTTPTSAATSTDPATTPAPLYVTKYSIVDDYIVVTTASTTAPATAPTTAARRTSAPTPAPTTAVTALDQPAGVGDDDPPPSSTSAPRQSRPPRSSTSTTALPADAPPIPPNCNEPHFVGGVWHCDD